MGSKVQLLSSRSCLSELAFFTAIVHQCCSSCSSLLVRKAARAAARRPGNKPPIAPIEAPKTTPARLPAYEPPNLAPQTEVCAEHGEPVATKTVLKGTNAGREYYCCSNAIPCGHFRWVPQKVPLPTGRLAGDANQMNRVVGTAQSCVQATRRCG